MRVERSGEGQLLADVVRDDACVVTRDAVKARCVEEMRARRGEELALLDALTEEDLGPTTWRATLARAGSHVLEPGTRLRQASPSDLDRGQGSSVTSGRPDFLESVRLESLSALRRRRLPVWFRLAAAAAVLVCVGVSVLVRWSPDPAPRVAETDPTAETVQAAPVGGEHRPDKMPGLPAHPRFVVATGPPSEDIIVRTADHGSKVELIGDDELLETLPGLAIARVEDPQGGRMVYVSGPGFGGPVRVN